MLQKYRRACWSLHAARRSVPVTTAVLARPGAFVICRLQRLGPAVKALAARQGAAPSLRPWPWASGVASGWSKKAASGMRLFSIPRWPRVCAEQAGTKSSCCRLRGAGTEELWLRGWLEVTIIFGNRCNLWCVLYPLDNLKWMFLRTLAPKVSCFFQYCSTTPLLVGKMEPGCLQQQRDEWPRRVQGAQPSPERASKQGGSCPPPAATAAGDICEPQKFLALSTTENKNVWVDKHIYLCAGTFLHRSYRPRRKPSPF